MTLTNPTYEYEVQWESDTGSRRVETIEGDGYDIMHEPNPYLRVWVRKNDNRNDKEDVFEVVGFNFTINRITT